MEFQSGHGERELAVQLPERHLWRAFQPEHGEGESAGWSSELHMWLEFQSERGECEFVISFQSLIVGVRFNKIIEKNIFTGKYQDSELEDQFKIIKE